jgi:hypothetical protein
MQILGGSGMNKILEAVEQLRSEIRSALAMRNVHSNLSVPNADLGSGVLRILKDCRVVKVCSAIEGGRTVMSEEVLAKAKEMHQAGLHKSELVNLFTPALMDVLREVHPDLRLVNSEHHALIKTSRRDCKAYLKADLFSAYFPMIEYGPPFENAPTCSVTRSFGRYKSWRSRISVHSVWDAKWNIDSEALGAKCKYLEVMGEDCYDENGFLVRMQGVLFDVDMFWMIKSLGKEIININQCHWSTPGSKEILIDFYKSTTHGWVQLFLFVGT